VADIESRKATVRAQDAGRFGLLDGSKESHERFSRQWSALQKAGKYFGYDVAFDDSSGRRNTKREHHIEHLAMLMAEVLFGRPGRGRQVRDWTEKKLHRLGWTYYYTKRGNPGLKDSQIVNLIISKDSHAEFGKDAERLRQRLHAAKRAFFEECAANEDVFYEHDLDVLKMMGLEPSPREARRYVAGPHLGTPWCMIDFGPVK
jgi:hypothetical protein